jgi:hypothetical protein
MKELNEYAQHKTTNKETGGNKRKILNKIINNNQTSHCDKWTHQIRPSGGGGCLCFNRDLQM